MKFGMAIAAACFALVAGTVEGSANEAVSSSKVNAGVTVETGYVTTQGRRGGSFRGGGGGRGVVVSPRRRGNVGRNVAIGVGAAIIGGIIANQAVQARPSGGNCRSWSYRCSNGSGWACRQLDRYC